MPDETDSVPEILHAIAVVDAAISLVQKALLGNISKEDDRSLRRALLRLEAERAVLEAELDAALDADTGVQAPDPAQIAQIERLSALVEQAKNSANVTSGAISLAGEVIELMTDVVTNG